MYKSAMKRIAILATVLGVGVIYTTGFTVVGAQFDSRATTAQGVLVGTTDNGVNVFLGVPFAAPPTGDRPMEATGPCHELGQLAPSGEDRSGPRARRHLLPVAAHRGPVST
jgi:hypothetical protein